MTPKPRGAMGAGGDATGVPSTALVVPRDDTAYVEWLASELCSATQNTTAPWSVCEIWRAQGRQARIPAGWGPPPSNPEPTPVTDDDVEQISLVFGAGAQRGCYSPMRAPRGHTCMRCLEDPTAKMLRVASHVTFSPGIGLVGRVWLLGVAEVVDVPAVGASSTYARQEAALNAGVRTAIALPVVPPAKTPGGPRAPSAVIVIYFGERLVRAPAANGAAATLAQTVLCSLLDRARLATQNEDIPPAPLVPASDAQPAGWKPPPLPPPDISPPDSRPSSFESGPSSYSDKVLARKLARSLAGQGASGQHQCPICFGAVEVAARVAGCAHVACADCLSRWRVTKDVCPVCEGPVYGVVLDAQLDFENAQRRGLQSF